MASLKTAREFREALLRLGVDLSFDEVVEAGPHSPLGRPLIWRNRTVGNRFAILPMEGWDGTEDGAPSELTIRRWERFGRSGAKLIWGGEAVAVCADGRANKNQLMINDVNLGGLERLRAGLVKAHLEVFECIEDLLVGLQLTHSGRFARPGPPTIAYRHPLLDQRFDPGGLARMLRDEEVPGLVDDFARAARNAQRAGFGFVDIKQCHGYLGHEMLSAVERPGPYGGSFENRTRFLREVIDAVRAEAPGLEIGTRVSVFDFRPFETGAEGRGAASEWNGASYRYAFGGDGETGLGIDLEEPSRLLELLESMGVDLICTTAGSPYYNPHILRPAAFPPSDGYLAPENPLAGVARQIEATARLKAAHPNLIIVGSAYTYLQEWLPNVAQRTIRDGGADFVGLGRMVLSYPELPADVLAGRLRVRKKICRTFSDCTTAPRGGMVSGCYPLDPFYKARPENERVKKLSRGRGGE